MAKNKLFKAGLFLSLTDDLTSPLGKAARHMTKFEQQAMKFADRFEEVGDRFFDSGKKIAAAGAGMLAPLIYAGKASADLEEAMADVRKVTDLNNEELGVFERQLKALKIPGVTADLAGLAASGAQMGVAQKYLLGFTRDVAKTAVAFDMLPEEAGESFGKLSNIFGVLPDQILSIADPMNLLSDSTAASGRGILEFTLRAGGMAKVLGLNAQQTAAFGAAMMSVGEEPERAATGFNRLLSQLNQSDRLTKEAQAGFRKLGLNAKQLSALMRTDGTAGVRMFMQAVAKSNDPLGALTTIIGEEAAPKVVKLAGNLEILEQALGIATNQTGYAGSVEKEFQNRIDTTYGSLGLLKKAALDLADAVGDPFIGPFKTATRWITNAAIAVRTFAEEHPFATRLIAGTTAAVGAFLVVVGGGLATIGLFAKGIGSGLEALALMRGAASGATRAYLRLLISARSYAISQGLATRASLKGASAHTILGTALRAKLAPGLKAGTVGMKAFSLAFSATGIGLIITGIALGALLIYKNWDRIKAFFAGFWQGIKPGLEPIMPYLTQVYNVARWGFEKLGEFLSWIIRPGQAANGELSNIAATGRFIGEAFRGILKPFEWFIAYQKQSFEWFKKVLGITRFVPGEIGRVSRKMLKGVEDFERIASGEASREDRLNKLRAAAAPDFANAQQWSGMGALGANLLQHRLGTLATNGELLGMEREARFRQQTGRDLPRFDFAAEARKGVQASAAAAPVVNNQYDVAVNVPANAILTPEAARANGGILGDEFARSLEEYDRERDRREF